MDLTKINNKRGCMSNLPKVLEHKEIIKCKPVGKYIGNYKCHINCLSYAIRHPKKVKHILGVAQVFNDNTCVAHFILELIDGTYIDPTYGNMSQQLYSYCIPIECYDVATFNVNRELQNLKDYLFSLQPWYYKLFHRNPY